MKIRLVLLFVLSLSACSTGYDPDLKASFLSTTNGLDSNDLPPKNGLNVLAKKLVAEMLSNNQFVSKQNAIAVTSIVDLKSLSKSDRLGQQISEGIVHYLHNSGYRVVDFKLTGTISVTPEGDFIHSRDWEQLKGNHPIDYLVSGTIDQYEAGSYLSLRMVGVQTQVVVASSQTFISTQQLQSYITNPELTENPELDTETAKFTDDIEQVVEQKVQAAFEQHAINKPAHETVPKNHNVYISDGYLIRK